MPLVTGRCTRCLFHRNVPPRFASIAGGSSNTIRASDAAGRPDLYPDGELIPVGTVNSFHPGGVNHVFADGSVHFVRHTPASSGFVALISSSRTEVISADSD